MNEYVVCCDCRYGHLTRYVFFARSVHDCRQQAEEHGLFGDKPIRIEKRFKHFIESEEF